MSSLYSIFAVGWGRLGCDMLGECGKSAVVSGGGACEVLGRGEAGREAAAWDWGGLLKGGGF